MKCIDICLEQGSNPFTVNQIADKAGLNRRSTRQSLNLLVEEGFVARYHRDHDMPRGASGRSILPEFVFIVLDWDGIKGRDALKRRANMVGSGRDRMWRAIRVLKIFTKKDLMVTAEVANGNAEDFLHMMRRAEFLKQNKESGEDIEWSFINDPGPARPTSDELRAKAEARREKSE